MFRLKYLALACLTNLASPSWAEVDVGRPADCKLTINGKAIIKGKCVFTPTDTDGSFSIATKDDRFFAVVLVNTPGRASGYWNETPFSGHAHTPLGDLVQDGACWVNDDASICAY